MLMHKNNPKQKLSRIEVNREKPYEVDEIFEILKTEFNIDLEALLKEHRKVSSLSLLMRRDIDGKRSIRLLVTSSYRL